MNALDDEVGLLCLRRPGDAVEARRLLRRRLVWFRVGCGSLVALTGYFIIGGDLFQSLTGTAAVMSLIPLAAFAASTIGGLAAAIACAVRLHRLTAVD